MTIQDEFQPDNRVKIHAEGPPPANLKWRQYMKRPRIVIATQMEQDFRVETEHGWASAKAGDYLISGINGELYPCAKETFEETYDWVDGMEGNHDGIS